MSNRILDLSSTAARLHVRAEQLLVEPEGAPAVSIPLVDLAVLVVAHPQVRFTQAVLSGLAAAGGIFVTCDRASLPIGMLIPLVSHTTQGERFAAQAQASLPTRKRLWQQIVRAKIKAQAHALIDIRGDDFGLTELAAHVHSGDTANVEARASRRYWPAMMNDPSFRRRRDAEDANRLLNYGYAVLRAIVARAICAAGLHPSLGVHHHNRYDAFCLADDLMEPFRPLIDRAAVAAVDGHGKDAELTAAIKRDLSANLTGRVLVDAEQRTLFDAAAGAAASLADVFLGRAEELTLPESLGLLPF